MFCSQKFATETTCNLSCRIVHKNLVNLKHDEGMRVYVPRWQIFVNDCIAARFNGSNTLLAINVIPAQVFFCVAIVPINVLGAGKTGGKLYKLTPGCFSVANVPIL